MNFRVAEARLREYGSRAFSERKVVHFEHSQILWLTALVVPLLGLFLGWAWRRRRERVTRFIHANLVEQLTLGLSAARRKAKLCRKERLKHFDENGDLTSRKFFRSVGDKGCN